MKEFGWGLKKVLIKRILAITIIISLCVGLLAAFERIQTVAKAQETASSVTDFIYRTTGDAAITIYGYTGKDTEVVIPAFIDGRPVVTIDTGAFRDANTVTTVTIPEGVTAIGNGTFTNPSLKKVNIPDSVIQVGMGAFDSSAWLASQPEGAVYLDGWCVDYKGTMSENAVLSLKEGTKGISMGAFYGCSEMVSINIPDSVKYIGTVAFRDCVKLTTFDISKVTSVGTLAFLNTAWYNNEVDGLVYKDGWCIGCKGSTIQENIEITEGTIGLADDVFTGTNFVSIQIPEGLKFIGTYAFSSMPNLYALRIPKSVTRIGIAPFVACAALCEINVAEDNEDYASKDGVLFDKAKTYLLCYPPAKTDTEYTLPSTVTCIGMAAASYLSKTNNIHIPLGVTTIGNSAFHNSEITEISIPDSVTSIGSGAFSDCRELTTITLSNHLRAIEENTFAMCLNLMSVTIPNSVKRIGDRAFVYCMTLDYVDISTGVRIIGTEAFYNCPMLLYITIPYNISSIGEYALGYYQDSTQHKKLPDFAVNYYLGSKGEEYALALAGYNKDFSPAGISGFSASLSQPDYFYDGNEIKPTVILMEEDRALYQDDDYTLTYANNVEMGTAEIVITGMGNYKGSIKMSFTIKAAPIPTATPIPTPTATPIPTATAIPASTAEIVPAPTLSVSPAPAPTGVGIAADISQSVSLSKAEVVYQGKTVKPKVSVTVAGKILTKGTDYTVTSSNANKIGTCKVTVKGIGSYLGTYTGTFKIVLDKEKITKLKSTKKKTTTIGWKKIAGANQYSVSYATSKNGTFKPAGTTSKQTMTVKKLKSGKKYYFKVKAYIKGKNYYSYSAVKSVKVK